MTRSVDRRWKCWCLLLAALLFLPIQFGAIQDQAAEPPRPNLDEDGVPLVLFNFKGQTWDQALDYFSRITGKPVVRDAQVPEGTVDFINPTPYRLPQAIETLNLLLQKHGLVLRDEGGRLVLEELKDISRENIPTFMNDLPEGVTGDQIVTVVVPLLNATAAGVAEQLKAMVASYGMLTALPEQNSLLIIDTAANVRRIKQVLDELDREDVGNVVEKIQLKYANAEKLLPVLESLMSERVIELVTKGKTKVEVEKDKMPAGFRITADSRTNSIIARGNEKRLERLRLAIAMLDSPDMGPGLGMKTIALKGISPTIARQRLEQLYSRLPAKEKPTYVLLDDSNRITIVGEPELIQQGERFLADLDGESGEVPDASTSAVRVLPLKYLPADRAILVIQAVFSSRQKSMVKLLATPNQESLIIAGPESDIAFVKNTLDVVDRPDDDAERTYVTFMPVRANAGKLMTSVKELVIATAPEGTRSTLEMLIEPQSGAIVVVGTAQETARALELLKKWDADAPEVPELNVQVVQIRHAEASMVARMVEPLLRDKSRWPASLQNADRAGVPFSMPVVNSDLESNQVMVIAPAALMPVAQKLIESLDQPSSEEALILQVHSVLQGSATEVAAVLQTALAAQASQQPGTPAPTITATPESSAIIVSATASQQAEIAKQLDQFVSSTGTVQVRAMFLKHSVAERIGPLLEQMLAQEEMYDIRDLPSWMRREITTRRAMGMQGKSTPVRVIADNRLNAVVVAGPSAVLNAAEQIVSQLDQPATNAASRSVRVLAIRNADATEVAASLTDLFSIEGGGELPPVIRVNRGSNTLLVRATPEQFKEIEQVASGIDEAAVLVARELRTVPIDPSRGSAEDVARMLERMLDKPGDDRVRIVPLDELLKKRGENTAKPADETKTKPDKVSLRNGVRGFIASLLVATVATAVDPVPSEESSSATSQEESEQEAEEDVAEIIVAIDPETNSLVVLGAPGELKKFVDLADQTEEDLPVEGSIIRTIPLPDGVNPAGVASVVKQTLQVLVPPGGKRADIHKRSAVVADPNSRSLIVTCNRNDFDLISQIVIAATRPAERERVTIRVYQLTDISAERASSGLTTLLSQARGRRFSELAISLDAKGRKVETVFDPTKVTVVADAGSNSLIVMAPNEALPFIDRYIELAEQISSPERTSLQFFELNVASATKVAAILDKAVIGSNEQLRANTLILPDEQSGLLVVRASEDTLKEIQRVLTQIDQEATSRFPVRTIQLQRADAQEVSNAIERFYDDRARIFSSGRGRRNESRKIAITGRPGGGTLLVACSDEDFVEITDLAKMFDTADQNQKIEYRIYPLTHARANDAADLVRELISELIFTDNIGRGNRNWNARSSRTQGSISVKADDRLNALVVTGQGDHFALLEEIIQAIDEPTPDNERRIVRHYRVAGMDEDSLSRVLEEAMGATDQNSFWWGGGNEDSGGKVSIVTDYYTNSILVVGNEEQQADAKSIIESISKSVLNEESTIEVIHFEYANSEDATDAVEDFLRSRRRSRGGEERIVVTSLPSSGAMLVSGSKQGVEMVKDLVAKIDRPDLGGERKIEIIPIERGEATEIARLTGEQFSRRGGEGVLITADQRTNSLLVNAPASVMVQVKDLVAKLDAPNDTTESVIRTYTLTTARADDAVQILSDTLRLDANGRTEGISIMLEDAPKGSEPIEVRATIVADRRSNSLVVTATEESLPVIEAIINRLEQAPARSPVEYRIITLKHAPVADVSWTLGSLLRARGNDWLEVGIDYNRLENQLIIGATSDQFKVIEEILADLDVVSDRTRRTDFVALTYADAAQLRSALDYFYGPFAVEADTPGKQNVRIIADEATNSLVITAPEEEWPGITALIEQLDSEEYDSSLQLKVIPLTYADARGVARAINDAFRSTMTNARRRGSERREAENSSNNREERGDRRGDSAPVLLQADEWVSASAEVKTNALIISANRQNMLKIERIVTQLDVPEFTKLPPPRLIRVLSGDPLTLAESLRTMYAIDDDSRGGMALRIVGDRGSNALIIRADDEEFAQISALAEALQQTAQSNGLLVRVLTLENAPAARVAEAVRGAFAEKAEQQRVPLSIQVDDSGNALVIASTLPLFEEISEVVNEMDRLAPTAGQGIFLIELENVSAESAEKAVRQLGLDKQQPSGSTSRIVVEPIKISRLDGRNSLLIVANPADQKTIVEILTSIDKESGHASTDVRVVELDHADADLVANLVNELIDTSAQQSTNPLAVAVEEQIRRLNISRGPGREKLQLDLAAPIRVIPDTAGNSVVIASSAQNTAALVEVVRLFDRLPATEGVTVQIFPLENMAADRFVAVIEDLFERGKDLASIPGLDIIGEPTGSVGPALLEEIAITIDERTNTVIVAGKDSAVALVEVLKTRLDQEIGVGWVEPRIITLRHADAMDIAELLQSVVIDGATEMPGASPLQAQVARMRALREGGEGAVESDFFVPLSRLVIQPEEQINALVVVGSPPNIALVEELVSMLDIESASPSTLVRIYPITNGSAERIGVLITQLFQQQYRSNLIREEDLLTAIPDARTNSLVVSTSPRSFTVFEDLLGRLDTKLTPEFREIRVLELASASAARLAPMIQQLMDARLERLRKVQPESADLERAVILPDSRSNSLVVAAGAETYEVIKRLAQDLDTGSVGDAADVYVVPVPKGGLDRIAGAIEKIMDRRYSELPNDIAKRQKPLVITDPRTSSLMVAAAPEDLRAIQDLVERLSMTPSNPAIALEVLTLDSASARELAPRLEALMRDRARSLGDAATDGDRVSVEADESSNSLIVAASEENLEVVRELVAVLVDAERARIGDQSFEIIPVARNRAADLARLVQDLYVDAENRRRGTGAVRVSADSRLNALLVSGTPEDITAIRDLVERLDEQKPGAVVEVRYIPLASANVLETVSLIESVLRGKQVRGVEQAGTVLRYLQELEGEEGEGMEVEVSSAIRDSISLTPDVRTNTVIVTAPRESMELIVRMINDLDASSTGSKKIEVFKLINADAQATAELLTDLFQLKQQGNLYVLKPREDLAPTNVDVDIDAAVPGGEEMFGSDLTLVPDERQALSITVDSRTNSLIVSGTPNYLDLVRKVIEDLDAEETNIRDTYVYQLRNAQASEVAEVVGSFVAEDQRKFIETLGSDQLPSAARLLEREVTIVGDAKSNSILVNASPEYMKQVKGIIEDLDVDPPQVMIEVLLAEITLKDEGDWGLTINNKFGQLPIEMGLAYEARTTAPTTLANFSISAKDLSLLLTAMESQGRVQILSNPSITVANNEDARIQVGQEIRVPDSLTDFDTGTQTSSVTPQEIGTILEVRPSINPDGFVRLQIRPELSRLESGPGLQVSPNFNTPVITKRTATTTVTVKDGETVVIGGLIQQHLDKVDMKVPFLGDIPLLGQLFRSSRKEISRTEVLIVLTPHVIVSPSNGQLRKRSAEMIDQMPLPKESIEEIRDGDLRGSSGVFNEKFEQDPSKEGSK